MADETSMALTGVFSGIRLATSGTGGLVSTSMTTAAQTGYGIATGTTSTGKVYPVLNVVTQLNPAKLADLTVMVHYAQTVAIAELDLDIRYTDMPEGTEIELDSTVAAFSLPKQAIKGSGLIGPSVPNREPFEMNLALGLWVQAPDKLAKTSHLTLSFSKIEDGNGPVKKVVLEQLQLNLKS